MAKHKHYDGFIGCRTSKLVETTLKSICASHQRDVSEVVNYLCRIFIEDVNGIRTRFLNNGQHPGAGEEPSK